MYTLDEEIIHFVFAAFHGRERKKEKIAMAFHSIMVGNMLRNAGYNDTIVNIGYLHDILEDTDYKYEDLKEKFGKEIADGVLRVTDENATLDWRERKSRFIDKVKKYDNDTIIVELVDKLQNLLSDYHLFIKNGKESLGTEKSGYENFKWYYKEFQKLFNERLEESELLKRYNEIMNIYFEE